MLYLKKIMQDNKITIKTLENSVFGGGYKVMNVLNKHSVSIDILKKIKEYFVKQGILNKDFDIGMFLDDVTS